MQLLLRWSARLRIAVFGEPDHYVFVDADKPFPFDESRHAGQQPMLILDSSAADGFTTDTIERVIGLCGALRLLDEHSRPYFRYLRSRGINANGL